MALQEGRQRLSISGNESLQKILLLYLVCCMKVIDLVDRSNVSRFFLFVSVPRFSICFLSGTPFIQPYPMPPVLHIIIISLTTHKLQMMTTAAITMKKFLITTGVVYLSVGSNAFHISPVQVRSVGKTSSFTHSTISSNTINVHFRGADEAKATALVLRSSPKSDDMIDVDGTMEVDAIFNGQTTLSLVGAQSLLVVGAVIAANILNVPNSGLGEGFLINTESIQSGVLTTLPLFVLAFVLDFVEKKVPALQDVTKATQRSVLGKIKYDI